MNHKWSHPNDKVRQVTQCFRCGIYRQYIKGIACFFEGDNYLPVRPNCKNIATEKLHPNNISYNMRKKKTQNTMDNLEKIITIKNPTKEDSFSHAVCVADAVKCKLTPKQNMILYCLQNGWVLITGAQYSNVWVGNSKGQFSFTGALFWRMVGMGFIYQQYGHPFDYVLTGLGEKVITKKVPIDKWM